MQDRICLGTIVGVHGIKGEVKVKSFTEFPEDVAAYGELEDKSGQKKFKLKIVGVSKELLRVKVNDISDRTVAESLIGTELYADRSVLPELEEEEFYHSDLIGLPVKYEDEEVGRLAAIHNFGAGDILEIKLNADKKSFLLPFTKKYVPTINIKNGYIIVSTLEFVDQNAKDEGNEG